MRENDSAPQIAGPLKSCMCTQERLESDLFQDWAAQMGEAPLHMHRKVWEWCFITQALHERGMLQPGKRGLGFAVGREPLSALFARLGCSVVATDQPVENANPEEWIDTKQHADSLRSLNERGLCPAEAFQTRVQFRSVDMTDIPRDIQGFDFLWSACAAEHLGSLGAGLRFLQESLRCLKVGGVAVHTTEFNVSSNNVTVESGPVVLFRRMDLETLAEQLQEDGHGIDLDFFEGEGPLDWQIDHPPYEQVIHLKIQMGGFVATSFGLIITKGRSLAPKPLFQWFRRMLGLPSALGTAGRRDR